MILALLAAATTLADLPDDKARLEACAALSRSQPEQAIREAQAWTLASATPTARHCLGLAYTGGERWSAAALAFEQAATAAAATGDGRASSFWVQGANAALAGDDPVRARGYLDRALAGPALGGVMRGEALLDRGRANLATNDLAAARIDIDHGRDLATADPFAWLLSASLARRQGDLPRAEREIGEALRLAPDDAAVALEAGNIAAASGAADAARTAWTKAAALAPGEPEGKAAAAALAANR